MNIKYLTISILASFLLLNCETEKSTKTEEVAASKPSKADNLFSKTLKAHGGDLYETANYEFVFRDKLYTFKNDGDRYDYTLKYEKNDSTFLDRLNNDEFVRIVNGKTQKLTMKKENAGREAINSVVYFVTLPHKLKDGAVNKVYAGETVIKDKSYDILEVSFQEEGGGTDHDDNFHYWINKETGFIDYLAYDYTVNEGGVRFRSANNTRIVDGITFQDYVNYKAEIGTALADLPALYEKDELKKLSEINTENVKSLSRRE